MGDELLRKRQGRSVSVALEGEEAQSQGQEGGETRDCRRLGGCPGIAEGWEVVPTLHPSSLTKLKKFSRPMDGSGERVKGCVLYLIHVRSPVASDRY